MNSTETAFKIGDYVVYGTNGVCKIDNITSTSLSPALPERDYYILSQVKNGSTIYAPVDMTHAKNKMRTLLDKETIDSLLVAVKDKSMAWTNDRKVRNVQFHEILAKGVSEEYLLMVRCIYMQKSYLEQNKKKLSNTDADILFTAQTLMEDEFSFVLGMPIQEVAAYVKGALEISDISLY